MEKRPGHLQYVGGTNIPDVVLHFAYVRNKVSNTLVANPTSEHGFAVVRDAVARRLTPLQLDELLGHGVHGSTWRAHTADGARVAVKRMSAVGEDPSAFFQRLERAAQVHHANLLDVVRALEETGELWVVSTLGTGVPLSTLLKGGRIRSGCAVAVGMGILSGLTALHQAGLWHGSVHARNVHVELDGTVRLGDHCLSPAPAGQSSATMRAADVRAAGALICSMLRIPLESAPAVGQRQALKMASSPLGMAAKAIAGPPRKLPAGYEAAHASLTLWEAARKMATSRRQAQARHDLANMVMAALGAPRPTVVAPGGRQDTPGRKRPGPAADPGPTAPTTVAPDPPGPARPAPPSRSPQLRPELPGPPPLRTRHPAPPVQERRPVFPPMAPAAPERRPVPAAAAKPVSRGVAVGAGTAARPIHPMTTPAIASARAVHEAATAIPWTLLGVLAAALLLAVCVLMAVAPALPVYKRSATEPRSAPAQPAPAPEPQQTSAPRAPALPRFGDVPVTTPIVVVPAAPGTAPAAAPAAPTAPAGPPLPGVPPGTTVAGPSGPGAAAGITASTGSTAPLPALADLPPAVAGDVISVSLDVSGCAPGAACTISVEVALHPVSSRRLVSWTLSSVDLCTGRTTQLATISVQALPGWNHVIGLSTVTLPAASAQVLVAITDSPARAASSLAAAGSNHCP